MQLDAVLNHRPGAPQTERHIIALPAGMCPYSGNPAPGSRLVLSYEPDGLLLDVTTILGYLACLPGYVDGELVRDMELVAQRLTDDAARAVGVSVRCRATIRLMDGPALTLRYTKDGRCSL